MLKVVAENAFADISPEQRDLLLPIVEVSITKHRAVLKEVEAQRRALQPRTGVDTIGGRNALGFIEDSLNTTSNPFGAAVSDAMFIAVMNTKQFDSATLFTYTGGTNRWQSHCPWNNGDVYFDVGGTTPGTTRIQLTPGWSTFSDHIVSFYASVTESKKEVYLDGSLGGSNASAVSVNTVGNIFLGYDGTSERDTCSIGEVVMINGTVTDDDRQKLEGYLAWKWDLVSNLPVGHPYKLTRPLV